MKSQTDIENMIAILELFPKTKCGRCRIKTLEMVLGDAIIEDGS